MKIKSLFTFLVILFSMTEIKAEALEDYVDNLYLIGGPGEWNAKSAMTMPFSHSLKDVSDDPIFTFVFEGNGGSSNIWFSFGDKKAIDAVAEGTWNKLFGTTSISEDLSGSFDRRYNLDGDKSFCVDGKAKYYRFQVNISSMNYLIIPQDTPDYILSFDVAAENNDGVTIYYNYINDKKELEVTNLGGFDYRGSVAIPEEVTHNNNKFKVTSIGEYAFANCSKLSSISIPQTVMSIGDYAFWGCSDLSSISIPQTVMSIGDYAFWGCSDLSSITIPQTVMSIGDYAFAYCCGLKTLNYNCLPSKLGSNIFSNSNNIKEAIFDCEFVTDILKGKTSLERITFNENVNSIDDSAFANCSGLNSVTIGSGVTLIRYLAFGNTNIKKTIWLTNTPPEGYLYAKGVINYVSNDQFDIDHKVVLPFLSSYFDVDGIRYVPISPSERTCEAIDCTYDESTERINIGETVTNKSITLTVKKINPYTCYGNKIIKEVKISHKGNIGDYAFYGCDSLKKVTICNHGVIGKHSFSSCSILETAKLGQDISLIDENAFERCSKLNSIVIPDEVTSVGSYAFNGCSAMTEVKIGSKVRTINHHTFTDCSSLPSIAIPKNVTDIKDSVFYGCNSLAKIIFEDSETKLELGSNDFGYPLFSTCPLDTVYIGRDICYNNSKDYGYSPFYRNNSLRAVKITDKETEISENEFYGCSNLQRVIIGDGVTHIRNWAFSGCSSLKFFAFGSQVKSIGKEAFSDCIAVTEIICKTDFPPVCDTQALDDINKWECKLIVPDNSLSAYQSADQWKEFFFIVERSNPIDDIAIVRTKAMQIQNCGNQLTVSGADEGTTINVFDIAGRLVGSAKVSSETTNINTSLRSGDIGIVKIGDKAVKVLMK